MPMNVMGAAMKGMFVCWFDDEDVAGRVTPYQGIRVSGNRDVCHDPPPCGPLLLCRALVACEEYMRGSFCTLFVCIVGSQTQENVSRVARWCVSATAMQVCWPGYRLRRDVCKNTEPFAWSRVNFAIHEAVGSACVVGSVVLSPKVLGVLTRRVCDSSKRLETMD